jgi:cation transport regulator ChaC
MNSPMIVYFGYGSLVNRATRPVLEQARPARLTGWRRSWTHRVTRGDGHSDCSSLTIDPADEPDAGIDGVLVSLAAADLPLLDARESGYERLTVPMTDVELLAAPESGAAVPAAGDVILVYRSLADNRHPASVGFPILQSYIDCVMAGYLAVFGTEGLQRFMQSTHGWHFPTHDDRADPRYPRAVAVDAEQRANFDQLIKLHK